MKHFYSWMFKVHPELLNLFNQNNQMLGGQPKKLLKTVAVLAVELPGKAIEDVSQKNVALDIQSKSYAIVGEHLLGVIESLLTSDRVVLDTRASLYVKIVGVLISRKKELNNEMEMTTWVAGWEDVSLR
jgi:nitric oxide dioxygenase